MSEPLCQKERDEQLSQEERDRRLVTCLLSLDNNRFEVWKYFEERADRLGEQLWSTGTWLMALVGATLSLPFAGQFIAASGTSLVTVEEKYPVVVIGLVGLLVCVYAFVALDDIRRHIMSNWRRAGLARTGNWKEPTWEGQKRFGWTVLVAVLVAAVVAFAVLIALAAVS